MASPDQSFTLFLQLIYRKMIVLYTNPLYNHRQEMKNQGKKQVKVKTKIKNKQLNVQIKLDKSMEIAKREIDILSVRGSGLMSLKRVYKAELDYIGPQGIPLLQYLKQPIVQNDFYLLMKQIADLTYNIENEKLFLKNLLLDLRYVYVNPMTKELRFIYLPVISEFRRADITGFMEAIVYQGNYQDTNTEFLVQYMTFLRGMGEYSARAVQEYLSDKCSSSGISVTSVNGNYEEGTSVLAATVPFPEENDMGTTVLTMPDDMDGISDRMPDSGYVDVHFPYFIRMSTNEKIIIDKDVFVLGKAQNNVDYTISDNTAISRIHAGIITKSSHYFAVDHNSTNKTYVDGAVLPPETETELMDGSLLKLANEEFEFHV